MLWRAGITRFKAFIIATYVADAYGVLVVAGAVGSGLADGAALMDCAVQIYYVVVAYLF